MAASSVKTLPCITEVLSTQRSAVFVHAAHISIHFSSRTSGKILVYNSKIAGFHTGPDLQLHNIITAIANK